MSSNTDLNTESQFLNTVNKIAPSGTVVPSTQDVASALQADLSSVHPTPTQQQISTALQTTINDANKPNSFIHNSTDFFTDFLKKFQLNNASTVAASTVNDLVSSFSSALGLTDATSSTEGSSAGYGFGVTPAAAASSTFEAAFKQFIANYSSLSSSFPAPAAGQSPLNTFFDNLSSFTTVTTTIYTSTSTSSGTNLPSYESIYGQVMGANPPVSFQTFVTNFISNQTSQNGYFLASQSLPAFIVQVAAAKAQLPNTANLIAGTDSAKVKVMINVLIELVAMMNSLQSTGIQQSKMLNFYTSWQTSFTESANNVPIYTADSGNSSNNPYFGNATNASAGDQIFTGFAQNLRDERDLVQSQGQQGQSGVNATNQAVQQQASLGTSILTQLSTIMQSLFK